jgi:protein-L-isoaspartate(D-aspartate) O-methyltransferase
MQSPAAEHAGGADDAFVRIRERMVREQIERRGIRDAATLAAMRAVPRHRFLPARLEDQAYGDYPLPIGLNQTISQPYIVALMTELARPGPGRRVLEVGTGCGYQTAVLAAAGCEVYSIEIHEPLALQAARLLRELGHDSVQVRAGDGYAGWPEAAPFDAIVVTAAALRVPPPLPEQLKPGGRLVIPVGDAHQDLRLITRGEAGCTAHNVIAVRFVPMTGSIAEGR